MAASESLLDVFWSLGQSRESLTAFQRILLITDGTVTNILEAFVAETIRVVRLEQSSGTGGTDVPDLGIRSDERTLRRTVLLQGTITGTTFIHGNSVILPDRLPPEVLDGLLTTNEPIGRLLERNRVETFREIVGMHVEPAAEYAGYFGIDIATPLVFRTYRIYVGQRPTMRITEAFPISWFGSGCALNSGRP